MSIKNSVLSLSTLMLLVLVAAIATVGPTDGRFAWAQAPASDPPAAEQPQDPGEQVPDEQNSPAPSDVESEEAEIPSPFGDPPGARRLAKQMPMWIDAKRKLVIIDGRVCLREGQLEMFACLKGTKEHESVVALDGKAFIAHAALVALGAEPGTPVEFDPEYKPATGPEVEVLVLWIDKEGNKHKTRAQNWVRSVKTKKAMEYSWVFPGSGYWVDEMTGQRHYLAEGGDFICVSNFPSAMLDLPVESTQGNQDLLFDAFTDRIPPLGTPVRVVLMPKLEKKEQPAAEQPASKPQDAQAP